MTDRPRILMASGHHWRSPLQLGSHHLARGFVRAGFEVAYVSYPLTRLRPGLWTSTDLVARAATHRAGGERDLGGRLWSYVPGAWLAPGTRPLLRGAWLARRWPGLTRPDVVATVAAAGFGQVDLLYVDNAVHAPWLPAIGRRRSVLRVADRSAGFGGALRAQAEAERDLARTVDLVLYTAESLEADVRAMAPRRMAHLPNGVDVARFAGRGAAKPVEYGSIPRPIALYVGAMERWLDFRLVDRAAARLPHVSFVLIGPEALARRRLARRPNLHLLGVRAHDDLPPYLQHADVGLIPFDVARHADLVNAVNPLKLYEYLAAGLPVVAVAWDELRRLGSPAILCETPGAFVEGIEAALASRPPVAACVRFAAQRDWSTRVEAILRLLDGAGAEGP